MPKLSVVICTYHPSPQVFEEVLNALQLQDLPQSQWEIILVDNGGKTPLESIFDFSNLPALQVIVESTPGLAHARLCGVRAAAHPLLVFVDDDNVLAPTYLSAALDFYRRNPHVGCFGGRSIPAFETQPPSWFFKTNINLGCQEYGHHLYISNFAATGFKITGYPQFAPIGTGMVIQKRAFMAYVVEAENNIYRMALGRIGKALSSGEDNDIILTVVKSGYEIAYVPSLCIKHIIQRHRYSLAYLKRMAYESNRSWVKVLYLHGISPWKTIYSWTLPIRKLKALLNLKPWQSELSSIRFQSAIGKLQGLSELSGTPNQK